jgi:hypothetical protein
MKTRAAAFVVALLAGASILFGMSAEASGVRPIVVELYTSQGCSSCIAADAFAVKLAQRPGVILMTLPVTYWDMFGWKDTLASNDNTLRQKAYAAAMRRGGVYTPQMIIDGSKDAAGGREDAVSYALDLAMLARDDGMTPDVETPAVARLDGRQTGDIAFVAGARVKTWARSAWSVGVDLAKQPKGLRVAIERAPETAKHSNVNATVWLFRLRSSATVKIGGGENNGRTETYKNVVTEIKNLGPWRGDPLAIDVPRSRTPVHDAIAVVVQQGGYGRVVGAGYIGQAAFYYPR